VCIGLRIMHSSFVIIVGFYCNLNFVDRFSETTEIPNLMKIRAEGAELFHAVRRMARRTDMTKPKVEFLNFANAPKNGSSISRMGGGGRVE
jgi:hypothetical protein